MELFYTNQTRTKIDFRQLSQAAKLYLKTKKLPLYRLMPKTLTVRPWLQASIKTPAAKSSASQAPPKGNARRVPEVVYTVTVAIVGQKYIQSLNRLHRSVDAPTDILTFTHRTPRGLVGEIYLNPQQASQKGYSLIELLKHGLDHCLGFHH